MITNIQITNYKSIEDVSLEVKPLTLFTGLNSTGKSSVLEAVLLLNKLYTNNGKILLNSIISSFDSIRNRYQSAKEIKIVLATDAGNTDCCITEDRIGSKEQKADLEIERNLYYLSANRIGAVDFPTISAVFFSGITGEFLLGTYEKEKSTPVNEGLVMDDYVSSTLASQVNYWLTYILGINLELLTEKRTEINVEVKFKSDGLSNFSPFQLGMGVSYLTKVLIFCLRARKGDVLIIENPEIHLHPAAQARLGEFFSFVVGAGIQLLIETHCEHLINRVQYEVFKKKLPSQNAVIYYKGGIRQDFQRIDFKPDGQYAVEFPTGFFDATLDNLLEME